MEEAKKKVKKIKLMKKATR
jgi:hypothetical protein